MILKQIIRKVEKKKTTYYYEAKKKKNHLQFMSFPRKCKIISENKRNFFYKPKSIELFGQEEKSIRTLSSVISVSENPIVQSHPVRWHGGDSTNRTGLSRFSHWFRYGSPAQFPPPVLFPVPFCIFHILREAHFLLLLLPLFLRFLCFARKTYFLGKINQKLSSPRDKKTVPEDRQERMIGNGV